MNPKERVASSDKALSAKRKFWKEFNALVKALVAKLLPTENVLERGLKAREMLSESPMNMTRS